MKKSPALRQFCSAGVQACTLLDASRGSLEQPIRSEIFGAARFAQHGHSLARAHHAQVKGRTAPFFPRLHDNIHVLQESHAFIAQQDSAGHHISPAGEWLLDNFYVVKAQVQEVHEGLPRTYFRDLPVLVEKHLAGLPRIYGVAWAFVAHTDSAFDEHLLTEFLDAYQQERELTLGELWALPTTLRVVLVENLRRLAERVATAKAARASANGWWENARAGMDGAVAALPELIDAMRTRGVLRSFVLQVLQRLNSDFLSSERKSEALSDGVLKTLHAILAEALPDPAASQVQQHADQAADNLSVRNAIISLRLLSNTDWRGLIARTSLLVRTLAPCATFRAERNDTQDASLHAIERLARRCGKGEVFVAQQLLALMDQYTPPPPAACVCAPEATAQAATAPGYWLRGPGLPQLLTALGLPASLVPWQSRLRPWVTPVYLGMIAIASAALVYWLVAQASANNTSGALLTLIALLAIWPASEAVIAMLHRLISESLPPERLPRLALADGVPAEHRVLVVIPTMLTSTQGIDGLMRQLELHYLANSEAQAQFALLTDFADAAAKEMEGDGTLLQAAIDAIDALEQRHSRMAPPLQGRRFLLLHRARTWAPTEQSWIGWERKRGKLEQLIAMLATGAPSPFMDLGARSMPSAGTPYIVTLDSDTGLPPGALRALVGVAAHPINQPCVDPLRRRVVSGYGILQPRLSTPLPEPQTATPFHWLFGGQSGIDPYSAATSEIYQDVFAEGSYTGKGLLNVQALHAVLSERLPEGLILSHDLLEGSIARCAAVTDINLVEEAPLHADVVSSRVHRWTRGDWQLWPILLRWRRFDLLAIQRWKMVDNLRRSLVAPMSVLLLLLCLWTGAVSPLAALALVVAAFGAGPLLGAVAGLAPPRDDLALVHFYRQALADVVRAAGTALWSVLELLEQSLMLIDAIGRALWRMGVSHRGLLRWTTAASAQALVQRTLGGIAVRHWPTTAVALVLAIVFAVGNAVWSAPAVVLCLLWVCTPVWVWWGSRPWHPVLLPGASTGERDYLRNVARDTWEFFARHVGPQSHHLPPDNVQTMPQLMVAERTSPTNIGLYLLSCACARRLKWIDTDEFLQRCESTLQTLEKLQRYRGHFLNWYDTQTLQPLAPLYVSTVDSGNLCGHLEATAGACLELLDAGSPASAASVCTPVQQERLQALAADCQRLAMQADFAFLYDPRRRLFHIGYRAEDGLLDKSYYDLLASEARLASLWAIAKGDVPVEHWSALGRPFFAQGTETGLRSWSGSMFEYLMPALVLHEPQGSALDAAARSAVNEQQAFAQAHGVPWGISESAYAASDHTLAYQYAPQGVPRLAMRRTPPDELVIAPYATALAAMYAPGQAVDNLRRMEGLQARGDMGFIEALDFTPERQVDGSAFVRVQTFMSHHQGMALVALTNVLLDGVPRRWATHRGRLGAVESLLQERVPRAVSRLLAPEPLPRRRKQTQASPSKLLEVVPGSSALQPTLLMSNGRYSVSVRPNGAGRSRRSGADVSRWRDDALRDAYGSFFYLRRHTPQGTTAPVSLTQHPAPDSRAHYEATLHSDHICLHAHWPDLRSCCTVWVSPEDDIELRRVELWNTSDHDTTIDLMSLFEVSLLDARADESHPAFANLFIHAGWDAADQALYFVRKPNVDKQAALHAVHFIAYADHSLTSVLPQTDRAVWMGRYRDAADPLAQYEGIAGDLAELATGLDPVASLCAQITVPAHSGVKVTFATAVADSRDALELLVDRYRQPAAIERSVLMSSTFTSVRMREMAVTLEDRAAIQHLTTLVALLHTRPAQQATASAAPDQPLCDRRALWRLGISGERPLVVVEVGAPQGMRLVRSLVQALRLWSWGGMLCDLVILNTEPRSYLMPLQLDLKALRERYASETGADPAHAGGLYVQFADDVNEPERAVLRLLARLYLHADGRSLTQQVRELREWHDAALDERQAQPLASPLPAAHPAPEPGLPDGRFGADDGSFGFEVSDTQQPARPWINVLANPEFGSHISEAGSGYSWAGNSRMNQLTVWSNDPVSDPGGETFWLQNLRTREVWNLGAGAGRARTTYAITHRQGVTELRHRNGTLEVTARWCVDAGQSLKHVHIAVQNHGAESAQLRVLGVLEWVMGAQRLDRQTVVTGRATLRAAQGAAAQDTDVLLATQRDNQAGFGGSTAFLVLGRSGAPDARMKDWTCDRRELFDARGQRAVPDHLGAHAGGGLDPCAAASVLLDIPPAQAAQCTFVLGHAATRTEALVLAGQCLATTAGEREAASLAHWRNLLGAVRVRTPDALFDALTNHWFLYQSVACRLWARAGFYQAGGAFGFRDQLQDTMALAVTAPQLLREQLLRNAARQFPEGDVQHWWHPPSGAGVRTHCSDDLLWMAYGAVRYIDVTGDADVLGEQVPFIDGAPIPEGAQDAYYEPTVSAESATLYEHCARAIDRSLAVGAHGLPLIGSGDWNDGMSRVGDQGKGESVWLALFLCHLVEHFAPLAQARGDSARAQQWSSAAEDWRTAVQEHAWDGEWFKRAFFDDGTPLGTHNAQECRIDLIAQAWSVLSGVASSAQRQQAMASAARWLVDEKQGLNRLLDPPLVHHEPNAGYIQAYPPGVRENGGQYSHGATWWLMAQAELGDAEGAYRTFTQLSPAHRSADPVQGPVYGLEPYVMTADVYTHAPYTGRGGWSWYTGSAAWMHRCAVESLCGLQVQGHRVRLVPQLPAHWPGIEITLRRNGRFHTFCVCRADAQDKLNAAGARGAVPLAAGEWLDLEALNKSADGATQAQAAGEEAVAKRNASCHLVVLEAPVGAKATVAIDTAQ